MIDCCQSTDQVFSHESLQFIVICTICKELRGTDNITIIGFGNVQVGLNLQMTTD